MLDRGKSSSSAWFRPIKAGSVQASTYTLCSIIIGSGVMGLPFAIYRCGLFLGTLMLVLGNMTCSIYYKVVVRAAEKTQESTYVGIVRKLYGNIWKNILQFSLIIMSIGMISTYQAMIAQLVNSVMYTLGFFFTPTGEVHRLLIIFAINLVLLFPLSLFRQLSSLRYASVISVISCIYIALVILVQTPSYLLEKTEILSRISLINFDVHVLDAICITVFCLEATRGIPIVYSELKKRTPEKMYKVIDNVILLTMVLYTCIGVFGYLSHIDAMPRLIVFRPPLMSSKNIDWPMVIARLWVALTLAMGVPINIHVTRVSILQFIPLEFRSNLLVHVVLTIFILIVAVSFAVIFPDAVSYFKFIGGTLSIFIGKILPTMLYFKVEECPKKTSALTAWTLLLAGLCIGSVLSSFMLPRVS